MSETQNAASQADQQVTTQVVDDPQGNATGTQQQQGEGTEGQPEGQAKPEGTQPEGQQPKPKKQREWWEDSLKEKSIETRRLNRQLAEAQQELERLRAQAQGQSQQPNGTQQSAQPQQPTAEQIEARAQQLARERDFTNQSNAAWDAGLAAYDDFEDVVKDTAEKIDGFTPEMIEAALEVGDAHKILYALGKNPAEAKRIRGLSPSRMGAALSKLVLGAPVVQPSGAPDPVGRGVQPRGVNRGTPNPDEMPYAEWLKWREANERKRR